MGDSDTKHQFDNNIDTISATYAIVPIKSLATKADFNVHWAKGLG